MAAPAPDVASTLGGAPGASPADGDDEDKKKKKKKKKPAAADKGPKAPAPEAKPKVSCIRCANRMSSMLIMSGRVCVCAGKGHSDG